MNRKISAAMLSLASLVGCAHAAVIEAQEEVGSVVSADGTVIGYRKIGRGPGLVVWHGMMESSASHLELARALSSSFTVYLPDRRGRGRSGAFGDRYAMAREVEDVGAVVDTAGARVVVGVSAGALVACAAASSTWASRPLDIDKLVLFEPPLIVQGSVPTDFLAAYDDAIARGETAEAMTTAMLGARMGPAVFQALPRGVLVFLTERMLAADDDAAAKDAAKDGGHVTMRQLAPTLHYDFVLAEEMRDRVDVASGIGADVLLLGGSDSPAYFQTALATLQQAVPTAKRVVVDGRGHGATGNADRGGVPDVVAGIVAAFVSADVVSGDRAAARAQ